MNSGHSVTLKDVATRAGVSHQTVARVVNNAGKVAAETRVKVEKAIAELNYVPNRLAQQLAGKKILSIGFASIDISLHTISAIMAGIKDQAQQHGYSLAVSVMDGTDHQSCVRAVNELVEQRVDGIIINSLATHMSTEEFKQLNLSIPCVFLDADPNLNASQINHDQSQGAYLAAKHLLDLGHRDIAIINGPDQIRVCELRLHGWRQALTEANIEPTMVLNGAWDAQSGYDCASRLLSQGNSLSAILVGNDQMSLGVLRAISDRGLQVPHDISVVGFDNQDDCAFYHPPLTTITQDSGELGRQSVRLLLNQISEPSLDQHQKLANSIVVRGSTKALGEENGNKQLIESLMRQLNLALQR
ncbi:LacI family DNA-binding transcriptional regulator [Alginatibacterium sediminis]|uniref:LacI family DNA-binding transcriptional regulator n=1 Tax=Alginatibacterium sediminis TaxID=2164068 RepID=UPI001313FA12|nr:LacI family DNA-binding transcriptional regulator [Alginatibacterium sediminis]